MTAIFDIKINEEYRQLAPELSEVEFEALKESIKTNGLHYAIAVNKDNILLDGHHRYRACQELAIEPKIQVKEFVDSLHEKEFVIEMATKRRHLNDYQKGELGIKLESVLKEIARRNQAATIPKKGQKGFQSIPMTSSNEPHIGPVADKIAKSVGLSPATYKRIKYIDGHGFEEQKQKLREGKARPNTEYKYLQCLEKKKETIAQAKSSTTIKILDNVFKNEPGHLKLLLGDFREQSKQIPDNSIDLIFTDPPYNTEDLPLYGELAKLAVRVLKPGGSLIVYPGHHFMIEAGHLIIEASNYRLKFIHQHIILHSGPREVLLAYNIGVRYKPLFWFVKDVKSPDIGSVSYTEDVIKSEPVAKEFHKWQQSPVEAEYMISHLTVENQVVLDPFLGGATTAIAALGLNRKFIGIEIEEDSFNIAKSRIAEFLSSREKTEK